MLAFAGDFQSPDAAFAYRPLAAIHGRADARQRPWPSSWEPGTGGVALKEFFQQAVGYQPYLVQEVAPVAPFAKLMGQVREGFGRTMTRLPEVFGVSRQTLYNWLNGDMPAETHHERIRNLAQAAQVFSACQFRPTSNTLDRTLRNGKTFLQLLAEGADGKETAQKLVKVVERSATARAQLEALLADEPRAALKASDLGAPALDERT